jgi:NAD(P)H-dependent FMN reductase
MRILAISGSLRARSSNTTLIEAAIQAAPEGMTITRYMGLGQLPMFNPDLDEEPLPASVAELRQLIGQSDGVLICSPEYARGIAGAMKNALDWLVGSLEFPGKPVAVVNASGRAKDADAHLRLTLRTMDAQIVETASVSISLLGRNIGPPELLTDPELRPQLDAMLVKFRDAIVTLARARDIEEKTR